MQGTRGLYMIWGHYIIGNGTFNLFVTLSNVLEPQKHFKTKFWKNIFFVYKICLKLAKISLFFYAKQLLFEFLVLGCSYGSNTLDKARLRSEVPFPIIQWPHIMYKPLALCIYTKNHFSIYGQNPYFHLWGPKGQLAVDQKVNRC